MQGTISFDGTLSGGITGGGGGSEVTITPVLTEGTKIADYSIDQETGSLYAPQSGSLVTITPTYIDGEKIADFSIDGVAGKIYTPEIFYIHTIEKEYTEKTGDTLLFYYTESDGDRAAIYCPAAQAPLTAGQNITIDANNVISASGGNGLIDYVSDTKIGTWDGGDLYQVELILDVRNGMTFDLSTLNIAKVRQMSAYEEDASGDYMIKIPYYESSNYWAYFQYRNTTHEITFVGSNSNFASYYNMRVIIEYKKSV